MVILEDYLNNIKSIDDQINKSSYNDENLFQIKINILDNFKSELTPLIPHSLLNGLNQKYTTGNNKYYSSISESWEKLIKSFKYKKYDINYFRDKKIFIYGKLKYTPPFNKFCTVVKNASIADIIVYDTTEFSINELLFGNSYHFHDMNSNETNLVKECKISEKRLKKIKDLYNISCNTSCESIHIGDILIFTNDEIISSDVENSFILMLKSEDEEIFNFAWKRLWEYNFISNRKAILSIIADCNYEYLKNKRDYYYTLWQEEFPNYF